MKWQERQLNLHELYKYLLGKLWLGLHFLTVTDLARRGLLQRRRRPQDYIAVVELGSHSVCWYLQ